MADYTEHYQLHQWQPQDPFLRTDFNADLAQIDKTLNTLADKSTALEAAVALCGNCRMEYFSYQGTGTYGPDNPSTLSFSKRPLFFLILSDYYFAFGSGLINWLLVDYSDNNASVNGTWSGNTFSFSAGEDSWQLNNRYTAYHVFSFYAET